MDSEGNDVPAEELGLLLWRGSTVCASYSARFNYPSADVICRHMKFTYATNITSKWSFDNDIQSNFEAEVGTFTCKGMDVESCSYLKPPNYCNRHEDDVFLSCSGN